MTAPENTLYYGDNLIILREYIPDESIDLVYLDPPFNSNRSYNVLFKDETGQQSEAQITAFDDTWHWNEAAAVTFEHIITDIGGSVADMVESLVRFMGRNQMTAYLVMMAARLVELHRVLKPTGSLYLHCDPTASHYLKVVLDAVFGPENYLNEVVWRRTNAHNDPNRFGRVHDVIFFYARDAARKTFRPVYVPYSAEYLASEFRQDEKGRWYKLEDLTAPSHGGTSGRFEFHGRRPGPSRMWRTGVDEMERMWAEGRIRTDKHGVPLLRGEVVYLDEKKGMSAQDWWGDVLRVGNTSSERLGYPTQKPLALLERIIQASSNEGDVVLDPFCGCGTAIIAAEGLKRRWIGIDITHLAIALNKYRLEATYPGVKFRVVGEPEDLAGAHQLAQDDRYQFQFWALSLIRARPYGAEPGSRQGKKGADRGVDGTINFMEAGGKVQRVLVQVKSGHVDSGMITALAGAVEREKAAMGIFITLEPPSGPMRREAASAGMYTSPLWNEKYPRIQIVTVEELLGGTRVNMPPTHGTFKQARRAKSQQGGAQLAFPDEGDADE